MTFDEVESQNIEEMSAWYGIKQLTEIIRFCVKMQYNRMVDEQMKPTNDK